MKLYDLPPFLSPTCTCSYIFAARCLGRVGCSAPHCLLLSGFLQPVGVGCDIFEDRPRLMEWRRRVEEAVGKELFFQAHEMILNIKELSNIQIDPQLKEHLAPVLMKMLKWINLYYFFSCPYYYFFTSVISSSTPNWKKKNTAFLK